MLGGPRNSLSIVESQETRDTRDMKSIVLMLLSIGRVAPNGVDRDRTLQVRIAQHKKGLSMYRYLPFASVRSQETGSGREACHTHVTLPPLPYMAETSTVVAMLSKHTPLWMVVVEVRSAAVVGT